MVIKTIYHFVDSNLGVEITSKKRVNRKRGVSFRSCSPWEGANGLPWVMKGLPGGPGVGENYD